MPSSTTSPSTWWKTGRVRRVELVGAVDPARADHVDRRRRGRAWCGSAPARCACAGPRRSPPSSTKNVSCIVRAGWSGPRLSASKLSHSASTSGPSATSQPIATKTSAMRSCMVVSGWRAPAGAAVVRQRDVDGLLDQHPVVALGLELGLPVPRAPGPTRAARLADALAGLGLGLRGQRADLAVGQGERAAVTGVREADCLERVEVGGGCDRGQGRGGRACHRLRRQVGDLDRVVGLVGCGHAPEFMGAPPPTPPPLPAYLLETSISDSRTDVSSRYAGPRGGSGLGVDLLVRVGAVGGQGAVAEAGVLAAGRQRGGALGAAPRHLDRRGVDDRLLQRQRVDAAAAVVLLDVRLQLRARGPGGDQAVARLRRRGGRRRGRAAGCRRSAGHRPAAGSGTRSTGRPCPRAAPSANRGRR